MEILRDMAALLNITVLLAILALIALDFILGVTVAILIDKNFQIQKLPAFLNTAGLAQLAGYCFLGILIYIINTVAPEVSAPLKLTLLAAATALIASMISQVLAKIRKLGLLQVPEALTK